MERKAKKRKTKTAFVPGVVFTTAVAGVVPACAVGCSNGSGTFQSVATCGYSCPTVAAVGYVGFDAGDAGDGDAPSFIQPDAATDAPEAGDGAAGDAPGDAIQDMTMSVADVGFRGD